MAERAACELCRTEEGAGDGSADPEWSTTELELDEPPDGFALSGNDLCLPN